MNKILEDINGLSAGTIAGLIDCNKYKVIDGTRADFLSYVTAEIERYGNKYDTWQSAWEQWTEQGRPVSIKLW